MATLKLSLPPVSLTVPAGYQVTAFEIWNPNLSRLLTDQFEHSANPICYLSSLSYCVNLRSHPLQTKLVQCACLHAHVLCCHYSVVIFPRSSEQWLSLQFRNFGPFSYVKLFSPGNADSNMSGITRNRSAKKSACDLSSYGTSVQNFQ